MGVSSDTRSRLMRISSADAPGTGTLRSAATLMTRLVTFSPPGRGLKTWRRWLGERFTANPPICVWTLPRRRSNRVASFSVRCLFLVGAFMGFLPLLMRLHASVDGKRLATRLNSLVVRLELLG